MKKFRKWLLIITGTLLAVIALLLFNPGIFKGPLENYLGKLTGYTISLDGKLQINVGAQTELIATDIHISNPNYGDQAELLSVGTLSLMLDSASLFKATLILESLQIDKLKANIEISTDGTGNWVTGRPAPPEDSSEPNKAAVVFKDIKISETSVSYKDGMSGRTHMLHITSLNQHLQANGMFDATMDGRFNDRPVNFSVAIGPYNNLLEGIDVSLSGTGVFGNLKINGNAVIDDLAAPRRPRFKLEMQGPDIDQITAMLDLEDLGSGGFSLRANGDVVDEHYQAGIHGKIGDISLNVSAQASDLLTLDEVKLELTANGPSLGTVTRVFRLKGWPDKPFSIDGTVKRVGTTLDLSGVILRMGGTQLVLDALLSKFPEFDASRVKLSLTGDDVTQFHELLGITGLATGPFELLGNLDISADELELVQVKMTTSLGRAVLSGTLGPGPDYTGTKLHVHLDGHDANKFVSLFKIDALPAEPFSLDTRIELVEKGILIERGVFVTMQDERLELGGLIAFNPGGQGTDIELELSGQDLAQMLAQFLGEFEIPHQAYQLSGRVLLMEDGIRLQAVKAEYEGIQLATDGIIKTDNRFEGTAFDFQLQGRNLSKLKNFPVIGDTVDMFVPGQDYSTQGRFVVGEKTWQLDNISGQVGKTNFSLNGLISPQTEWSGSNVQFSIEGPDLHTLIADNDEWELPAGPFDTTGRLALSDDTLKISGFGFKAFRAHGKADLELGWPITADADAKFSVDVQGDDLDFFLPKMKAFEPASIAFRVHTEGQRSGKMIALQQFEANFGNLQVLLKGRFDEELSGENVEISFSLSSEDLSALGQLNGKPLPAQALELTADFYGNANQFVFNDIDGKLGESHIGGKLEMSFKDTRPKIKITMASKYIDIRPFIGQSETDTDEEPPAAAPGDRMIPATPLPLETLNTFDGSFKIRIDELRHHRDRVKNIVLDAEIQNGILTVPQLALEGSRGKLNSSMSIKPTTPGKAVVSLDLRTKEIIFNLTGQTDDKLDAAPALDIIFSAHGTGANTQELAGSLNGSVYLGSKGGKLEGVDLSILDTFILEDLFKLIMPQSDNKEDLDLSCVAAIMKFTDGVMESDPAFAFTSSKIALVSKGSLNLKTEKMNFNFNATPNNALQISAGELFNPYILVSGTLSNPAVGLDPGKVLVHGGAAIGTAGLSILAKGLIDRVGNVAPLCDEMLKKVQQQ